MTNGFHRLPVLDAARAEDAAGRALLLRDHWKQRNDTGLYFTIGAVSQEDANAGVDVYCREAESSNTILKRHFSDVLEALRLAVETWKGEPVRYHDRFGLPGIMIYLAPMRPAVVVGNRPHIDMQHRLLPFGDAFAPTSENLASFTLALRLPKRGAGLRTWPEFRGMPFGGVPLTRQNATFIDYEVGSMLCHDGLTPHHGVGMRTHGGPDDMRITIQGFGVRVRGEWVLYW